MPVDALPARDRLKETPEVEALCRLPLAFLQAKASAEYREDFERTARPMVEEGRMNPIRYALAAHLDITPAKLSCDPADYPASKFNKLFLDRVVNRFTVEGSEYLTYHEALATGYTGKTVSTTDDSCSLAPCDRPRPARSQHQRCGALAGQARRSRCRFPVDKWSSGLQRLGVYLAQDGECPALSDFHRQTAHLFSPWNLQVDLLLPNGPTGLHLTDLHDVQLVCNRAKAVAEKDKKGSRPAKNLAAAEEKTATSSRSDRLRTNDMETNDTTADDYSMAPSMSNSVPGTAASTPAGPAATSAATLGRRRSNRRAVAPTL